MSRRATVGEARILTRTAKVLPIVLPAPERNGQISLESCLARRRSSRAFEDAPLTLPEIGQVLWAAQGVTHPAGMRTAPSAKAIYCLRLDLICIQLEDFAAGVYRYDPETHRLAQRFPGDLAEDLVTATGGQEVVGLAAAVILMSAVYRPMLREFGERGVRLAWLEAGHLGQNIALQATSLGLGCLTMGAFDDAGMKSIARLAEDEEPIYMVALGHK